MLNYKTIKQELLKPTLIFVERPLAHFPKMAVL